MTNMTNLNCDEVLMALMARLDSETAELSGEQIDLHLARCANCRHEADALTGTDALLKMQNRSSEDADVWQAVKMQIGEQKASRFGWQPFAMLGMLLVIYRFVEMLPERDPGLAFKLVPLLLVAAVFLIVKENPFRINAELTLDKVKL